MQQSLACCLTTVIVDAAVAAGQLKVLRNLVPPHNATVLVDNKDGPHPDHHQLWIGDEL